MSSFASGKFAYLVQKLTPAGTMIIDRALWVTSGRLYLVNDNQVEWISFSGISGSGSSYTLSGVVRDIDPVTIPATSDSTGKTWLANQKCLLVAMHDQLQDNSLAVNLPNYANATARDTAIPSPVNGMMIYNSGTGTIQQYIGGAWSDIATGSTVNATETVAGKVEIATQSEVNAGTRTGGSGAILVVSPDTLLSKVSSALSSDVRTPTSVSASASYSLGAYTVYSSATTMTRWWFATLYVQSSSGSNNPWYAYIETSPIWANTWTDSGYVAGVINGTSEYKLVPMKGNVDVRIKVTALYSFTNTTWYAEFFV